MMREKSIFWDVDVYKKYRGYLSGDVYEYLFQEMHFKGFLFWLLLHVFVVSEAGCS